MNSDEDKITISWDEVKQVDDAPPTPVYTPPPTTPSAGKSWGTVGGRSAAASAAQGSIYLKSWFYLGLAGLLGAFLAWLFCEPSFEDGLNATDWGNVWILPLMVILMSVGYGTAESAIERSWTRALLRGLASIGLGLVLGFFFYAMANYMYNLLLRLLFGAPENWDPKHPLFWLCRGLAWAVFGIVGGLIFGIVSKSGKKCIYGMLGGAIGAGIGGLLFDPISSMTGGAEASRAIGMSIVGAGTGIAMGLVESALKERWLYIAAGPLAGKQFILYRDHTTIGKQQSCDVYLFKDPSILDQHAVIELRAERSVLTAYGDVMVSGQHVARKMTRLLTSGDTIQIGRYAFQYSEKVKKAEQHD